MKAENFQEVYLRFGVYEEDTLFYARGGNFASRAWTISNEAFKDVIGQKFDAITGDDGKVWNINRYAIRRLKDQEEFDSLLSKSVPAFRLAIEIEEWRIPVSKWIDKEDLLNNLSELIDKFGYDHILEYAKFKLLK